MLINIPLITLPFGRSQLKRQVSCLGFLAGMTASKAVDVERMELLQWCSNVPSSSEQY